MCVHFQGLRKTYNKISIFLHTWYICGIPSENWSAQKLHKQVVLARVCFAVGHECRGFKVCMCTKELVLFLAIRTLVCIIPAVCQISIHSTRPGQSLEIMGYSLVRLLGYYGATETGCHVLKLKICSPYFIFQAGSCQSFLFMFLGCGIRLHRIVDRFRSIGTLPFWASAHWTVSC